MLSRALLGISSITEVVVPSITPGTKMVGGYWGGRIQIGASQYDLIISPNPMSGDFPDMSWSIEAREPYTYWDFDIEFNSSQNDGWSIMESAKAAGVSSYATLSVFAGITSSGYTDWYLGSLQEMEIIYRNLKPGSTANVTTAGTNPSAVPPTTNYTTSLPAQTTVTSFRAANVNAFREEVYMTCSRGASGDKQRYATISFVDGSVSEAANSDSNWSRAIRRQLVV